MHPAIYGGCMHGEERRIPAPPGGLRPAQLGIVLEGRVVARHISATLADLAQRGFLRIEAVPGRDWVLADLRSGPGALLPFEAILLDGLFARRPAVRLSQISEETVLREDLILVLNRVRARLRRDAVRHGRLRFWRRGHRTRRGEILLTRIHGFREDLRALASAGLSAAEVAPYAMIVGLSVPGQGDLGPEFPESWFHRLETAWYGADLSNVISQGAGTGPTGDFAHRWPAIRDYGHGGHDPGSGGGHVGGGHIGGHVGGGMDGGHGGGH
jgi:hypothetical protein